MKLSVETQFSDDCSAISFYGIDVADAGLAAFHESVTNWFLNHGGPPDKISIQRGVHNSKWRSFKTTDASLRKSGFEGISGLFLVSLIPNASIPVNDYLISAMYSREPAYAAIVCRSSIAPLRSRAMLEIAEMIARDVKPAYGIGYSRSHRLGPAMYAIGLVQGLGPGSYCIPSQMTGAERTEAENISQWGNGMDARVWQKGLLRDVYPLNFLTTQQLSAEIDGSTLEQWLKEDSRRGELDPFYGDVALWSLKESQIAEVRQALSAAGLIFDWRKIECKHHS